VQARTLNLSNFEQKAVEKHCKKEWLMAESLTLLCMVRDPRQLSVLQENGYELLTAVTGQEGLRLVMSQTVDAVLFDYHLEHLDGAALAAEIKQHRAAVPIVMLTDHMELPYGALTSVDALVNKSDGVHFLLATLHFVLNVKPAQLRGAKVRSRGRPLHKGELRSGS
jgi:CheY-like chemotaxis protein